MKFSPNLSFSRCVCPVNILCSMLLFTMVAYFFNEDFFPHQKSKSYKHYNKSENIVIFSKRDGPIKTYFSLGNSVAFLLKSSTSADFY